MVGMVQECRNWVQQLEATVRAAANASSDAGGLMIHD